MNEHLVAETVETVGYRCNNTEIQLLLQDTVLILSLFPDSAEYHLIFPGNTKKQLYDPTELAIVKSFCASH